MWIYRITFQFYSTYKIAWHFIIFTSVCPAFSQVCVSYQRGCSPHHASASSTTSPTPWSTCTGYESASASNSSFVTKCQRRTEPSYLADLCIPVSAMSGRTHLRSAIHCDLIFPRTRLGGCGPRSFAVSGPATWNSLPPDLRDMSLSAATVSSTNSRLNCSSGHIT